MLHPIMMNSIFPFYHWWKTTIGSTDSPIIPIADVISPDDGF